MVNLNINNLTLAFNLWWRPFVLAIVAIFVQIQAERMQGPLLSGLIRVFDVASAGLFLLALAMFAWGCWKLWCATTGRGELCHACGGPTRFVSPGRYSPHYRCLACGTNRRAMD